jgi:radical SAM superfamily enzyme YgiQ (UPF0313 family)
VTHCTCKVEMARPLHICALSAPHWENRGDCIDEELAPLGSATPFSLLNALRGGFSRVDTTKSAWAISNFRDEIERKRSIAMFDHLPDALDWIEEIAIEAPDVLLIGAMTLSLPGAIACARQIRKLCPQIVIALGGKHVTETLWCTPGGNLAAHPGAPIGSDVDGLFDILISGDAEDAVAELIEAIAQHRLGCGGWWNTLVERREAIAGEFVLFHEKEFVSGKTIPNAELPLVYRYYPIGASFPVLETERTAHAYSYTSKGCIYRCSFCSESAFINGPVKASALENAGHALATQFKHLKDEAIWGNYSVSAFVEDSIFLQGYEKAWFVFADEIASLDAQIPFGCQLTVDIILSASRDEALKRLVEAGMRYVFFGMETGDELVASAMSKNVGRSVPWQERSLSAVRKLTDLGIDTGVSVLFGLGENPQTRRLQMEELIRWRTELGQPKVISLNWAVKHPLRETVVGDDRRLHDYRNWGTPNDDPRLPYLMNLFGEASLLYPLDGVSPPTLPDLEDVARSRAILRNLA